MAMENQHIRTHIYIYTHIIYRNIYLCHHIPLYPTTCLVLYQLGMLGNAHKVVPMRPAWLPESLDVEDEDQEMKHEMVV